MMKEESEEMMKEIAEESRGTVFNAKESKLPVFLRLIGAMIIISTAIGFAIKDWTNLFPWQKCSFFLIFTVIIAAVAGICKFGLKDKKSTGVLYAVAAAMTPIHFSQFGGFLMNTFGKMGASYGFSQMVHWQAEASYVSILLTIVGVSVLIPIVYCAFSSLLSKDVMPATRLYLATNAILLLPYRSVMFVTPVTAAMIFTLLCYNKKLFAGMHDIGTVIVRIMMAVAPILMAVRMYYIYDHTAITVGISILMFSAAFFIAANYMCENVNNAISIQSLSTIGAVCGWAVVASDLLNKINYGHEFMTFGLPLTAILYLTGRFAKKEIELCYIIALFTALITVTLEIIFYTSCFSATLAMLAAIVLFCYGCQKKEGIFSTFGTILFLISTSVNFKLAMQGDSLTPWFIIASAGILIVVFASVMEKKNNQVSLGKVEHVTHVTEK